MTDYANLFRLDGKHAVVVGAGSGIGREAALALAAQGARVTAADRDLAAASETAALGNEPHGVPSSTSSTSKRSSPQPRSSAMSTC